MGTVKTTIHVYYFDVSKSDQKAAYEELRAKLKKGPHCIDAIGDNYGFVKEIDGREIELETEILFDNQWNTAPIDGMSDKGLRVFDWAQDACLPNKNIKRGHYLEQMAEMKEIRRNRVKCGYCGRQEPAQKGYAFCPNPSCLDSEYLKESDLFLTRMMPVSRAINSEIPPLTQAEKDYLLPLYREAQLHGSSERGAARLTKQRADIEAKFNKETAAAKTERDGLIWLLDQGVKIDNCIYYDHTDKFSFGWRSPVSAELRDQLLGVLTEFPFAYEIKCADGQKLEAY